MKLFPTSPRRVTVVNVSSGGEVTANRLVAETREVAHRASESQSGAVAVRETHRRAAESVTAAVLGQALETARRASEVTALAVTARSAEAGRRALDSAGVSVLAAEYGRRPLDTVQAIIIPVTEQARRAAETTALSVSALLQESGRRATDSLQAVIIAAADIGKRAVEQSLVSITLNGYANANVSTTGWTNPANALGNTTGTNALLSATSSGLAGITSNTVTGTMVVGFADPGVSDLTLGTVTLRVENSATSSGTLPLAQAWNVAFEYSLNGSTWTAINTLTAATAKGIRTLDITAAIGGDWSKLNALQVRATGSVTSGTGLSANASVLFFRAWVTALASKAY